MSESVIIKAIKKQNDVFEIVIILTCFECGIGKSRLPRTFNNFGTFIRHIEQCHGDHMHYKTLRNALKKYQTITKYYSKKVKKA